MPNLGLVKEEHWKVSADTLRTLIPLWQEELCDHKRLSYLIDAHIHSLNVAGSILSNSFKRNCIGIERDTL